MKRQTLLLFLILFIGCHKQQIHINDTTIQKLSKYNIDHPSSDIAFFLFVKSSNGMICRLNINMLYRIYHWSYSKSGDNFKTFISKCLNQIQSINSDTLKKRGAIEFQINRGVDDDLRKLNISRFLDKYCETSENRNYELKKEYKNSEQINTILYCFFINNFKVLSDDYSGKYVVIR